MRDEAKKSKGAPAALRFFCLAILISAAASCSPGRRFQTYADLTGDKVDGLKESLVVLFSTNEAGEVSSRCNAVALSGGAILTAAHCFPKSPGASHWAAHANKFDGSMASVPAYFIHPDYDAGKKESPDIAVACVARSPWNVAGMPGIVDQRALRWPDFAQKNKHVAARNGIGAYMFGCNGPENIICDKIDAAYLFDVPGDNKAYIGQFSTDTIVSGGWSGSGVYVVEKGVPQLLGISVSLHDSPEFGRVMEAQSVFMAWPWITAASKKCGAGSPPPAP